MTATTGRTVLAIVAILSLLLSAFAIASPVVATEVEPAADHCPNHAAEELAGNKTSTATGDVSEQDVSISWAGDPGVLTLTNNNDTNATVVWCAKGGEGFGGDTKSSGQISSTLTPDETKTYTFGTAVSYFILYSVTVEPPVDECVEASEYTNAELRDLLLGAGSNVDDPRNANGSTATTWGATVTVPEELCDVVVSFTSYTLPGGYMRPFADQVLYHNVTATYLGGTSTPISVNLPFPCGWQVDLYIGEEIATLHPDYGHPADKLMDWSANETGEQCGGEEEDGTLQLHKLFCEGTGEQDPDFDVFPAGQQQIATTEDPTCEGGNASFTIKQGEVVVWTGDLDNDTDDPTDVEHIGLKPGTYTLIEDGSGASVEFTIVEGDTTIIVVRNFEGQGQIKVIKYFCDPEAEASVEFFFAAVDLPADCEPASELDLEAQFQLWAESDETYAAYGVPFWTTNGSAAPIWVDPGSYKLEELAPLSGTSDGFDVPEYDPEHEDQTIVTVWVFNTPAEDLGSITIDKQLEECEACEAYTPGYWFNRGGGGGVDWANEWLGSNSQVIDGVGTFDSVEDVQAYLDADRDGSDGAKGLSATGQLLRHYLALVLNVAFADANDCDLGSLIYGEGTIADWLAEALAALEGDATDDEKREIKDALDAINNSDAGDGTLECGDSEAGPHAGVMFELYDAEDQLVDSGTTGDDGSLVLDGNPDGIGLPLGTYTLVEGTNDADLECTIVSVTGDGATLNQEAGTVTIVLTEENAHVTITVVNDCEEPPGEEDEFGHISVVKETDEAEATESFNFTATWDTDGFTLKDGDLEPSGDLLAGADYTVTEVLSPALAEAGWSLEDLECTGAATWSVGEDGMSVTVTLGADEDVVCTFTNEFTAPSLSSTPTLRLEKSVTGDAQDTTEFPFTLGGVAIPGATASEADASVLLASAAGTYVIAEGTVANWNLTGIDCTGNATAETVTIGTRSVSVIVGADEDVVCTFTNAPSGTLAGNPTPTPTPSVSASQPVRSGTLAGSLPNTAMESGSFGGTPAVLLAIIGLAGLAYVGRRNLMATRQRS